MHINRAFTYDVKIGKFSDFYRPMSSAGFADVRIHDNNRPFMLLTFYDNLNYQ